MGGYCNSSEQENLHLRIETQNSKNDDGKQIENNGGGFFDNLVEAAYDLKENLDDMELPSIPDVFKKKYQFNF